MTLCSAISQQIGKGTHAIFLEYCVEKQMWIEITLVTKEHPFFNFSFLTLHDFSYVVFLPNCSFYITRSVRRTVGRLCSTAPRKSKDRYHEKPLYMTLIIPKDLTYRNIIDFQAQNEVSSLKMDSKSERPTSDNKKKH